MLCKIDMWNFVDVIFGISGSCYGYCEVCGKSHPACGGENFIDGRCPDDCYGSNKDFLSITLDWSGCQVGECCFEKVFGPVKNLLDEKRYLILEYHSQKVEIEKKELQKEEILLKKCTK